MGLEIMGKRLFPIFQSSNIPFFQIYFDSQQNNGTGYP
jgi:hypothetical protein